MYNHTQISHITFTFTNHTQIEESSLYNVPLQVLAFVNVNYKNGRSLRKPLNLAAHRFSTTVGQQCFVLNAVYLWNDLPSDKLQTDTSIRFDSSAIDWLLTKQMSDFDI